MAEKKPVRVTIYGQTLSVRTGADSGELEALAHELDQLMSSIASRTGIGETSKVAILAALHLADQLKQDKGEVGRARVNLDQRLRQASELLASLDRPEP